MQLNLNITLSLPFTGKMSSRELDSNVEQLCAVIDRLRDKYGREAVLTLPASETLPSGLLAKNRAYLERHDKQRTPRVTEPELKLRSKFADIVWEDIEARRVALLTIGYDIFNPQRDNATLGKRGDVSGETFAGDIDLDNPAVE
jgi:hypothetical protein